MRYWLTYFILVTALNSVKGQSFHTELDTTQIKIGEQCHLILNYNGKVGDTLKLPAVKDTINTHIEILQATEPDTLYDSLDITLWSIIQSYTITSFDSGYWPIPPISVVANSDTISSDPLLLSVMSIQVDTSKAIYDIKAPLEVAYTWKDWLADHWHWFVWALAIIGALLALFLAWRHYRNRPIAEPVKAKPKIPPHIIALRQLDELEENKLWQKGHYKKYHSKLTDITRNFIEQQLGVPALEQITDEILESLRHTDTDDDELNKLAIMLRLADMVKFAKAVPVATENTNAMDIARSFVKSIADKMDEDNKPEQSQSINNTGTTA